MVCAKTLYNYIDLGLLEVKNVDLPYKLRINTKPSRVRKNKKIMNTLPRKILVYNTPKKLFDEHLDSIYTA